jgi:hypothetical protein
MLGIELFFLQIKINKFTTELIGQTTQQFNFGSFQDTHSGGKS